MIQLATDPSGSRMNFRPAANDAKAPSLDSKQGRSGHAWPFLSRDASRPAPHDSGKIPGSDSGS